MNSKPLVSILIPAYNAEAWIADTIRSALQQSWPRKEIIVVDDGSTDQTFGVARQFASRDVAVITHENKGAASTRNRAFSLCQGEYIQWLDADDQLSPDKISKQMEAAEKYRDPRLLLSSEWGFFTYRTEKAKFCPSSLWCDLSPVEWLIRKLAQNLHMQTATWLTSRSLTNAAGAWDTRMFVDDDGEYFSRVLVASEGVRFVPGAKVFYRLTPSSLSNIGNSDRKKDAQLLSMQLHLKYILSLEDSDRTRAACLNYIKNWLLVFYPERPDVVQELEELAKSLGGCLEMPRLRWKYAWIQALFGWGVAKRAQFEVPRVKLELMKSWDRAICSLVKTSRATIGNPQNLSLGEPDR